VKATPDHTVAGLVKSSVEWAERFFNVQRWTPMASGGHFAAMEEPELLAEDIRAFFRPLRSRIALGAAHTLEVAP
jgi:hypothetical protein